MATFDELKKDGIKLFGEVGTWAFDEWKMLNDIFFDGENKAGAIIWGSTPQDKSLGYYLVAKNLIYLHKTLMRPVYPTNELKWGIRHLNKRAASDVLLHEMIHQKIHQTGGWVGETSHNNERFVEEANRIAKLLGMDIKARVIKQKTIGGKLIWYVEPGCLTLKELSDFPYSSRTYNYYYGRHWRLHKK
jgi:hypothetical protein